MSFRFLACLFIRPFVCLCPVDSYGFEVCTVTVHMRLMMDVYVLARVVHFPACIGGVFFLGGALLSLFVGRVCFASPN